MIGLVAIAMVAAVAITGISLAFDRAGGGVPPIWDGPVWDGSRFVVNDASFDDDPKYWTSSDGIEWTSESGLVLEAGDFRCHPDFPCDVEPDEVEQVPLLLADPQAWIVAGREDIALAAVTVRYDMFTGYGPAPEDSAGPSGRLHPRVLAMAARESECFDELRRLGPDHQAGSAGPVLAGYQGDFSGNRSLFSVSCLLDGEEDRFTIDMSDHLDQRQLQLLLRGSAQELWVVRADGSRQHLQDHPRRR